jgi:hypothetical protein
MNSYEKMLSNMAYEAKITQIKDELASALEDLDREVKIGNDLMADNAKYREALEMARVVLLHAKSYGDIRKAVDKINEVLNK